MKLDHKFVAAAPDVQQDGTFKGYASLFGVKDQGGDIVMPGAFDGSLATGRRVRMLRDHDPGKVIGKWTIIRADDRGLYVEGKLFLDTAGGKEAYVLLKEGGLEGLSIGYRSKRAKRTSEGRELHEVELWEVSVVTFPMLEEASVSDVKSYEDGNFALFKRMIEEAARDAGFPSVEAKAAAAGAVQGLLGARDAAETNAADVAAMLRQITTSL